MNKEIIKIEKEDWFKLLIDDCKAIIDTGVFESRWTLISAYHALGARILKEHNNFERAKIYGEKIVQRVAESLGKSERTIFQSLQFVKKYPDMNKLPGGKNISWHKICRNILPELKQKQIPLPEGKFRVIYSDPPWQFDNEGFDQSAEKQYPTMPIKSICDINIRDKVGDKAVLFLWVTNAFLEEGLRVCKEWGFEYKTNMIWIKDKGPTIGWFTQSRHEMLFIATKGEGMHPKEKLSSWFEAPVTKHSKKPEKVYDMIEQMYEGPYLELFARPTKKRPRWTYWGNEV
jgi:N6-adenosine-specific RNA methylase IME4